MACLRGCDAVLLAGGQGSRLRTLFPDRPKVLVPVNGRPVLEHLVEWLMSYGVARIVLALGHRHEQVLDHLRRYRPAGCELVPSVEPSPLGTGGALRLAAEQVRSDRALVLNADSFTRADLCAFAAFHRQHAAAWSLVLTACEDASRYALVETDDAGAVRRFAGPPSAGRGYINAGLYLAERPAMLDWIPAGQSVSLEHDVFPQHGGQGLWGWRGTFPFIDIGTPESYRQAAVFMAEAQVA